MAFQIAQPRPRAQVASSNGSRSLKTRLPSPDRNVHAIVVSQAGSPTPQVPKSMTRAACRVDLVQRDEEVGQVGGELRHVRDPLGGGGIAVDPPVYRPGPGETVTRYPLRKRFGNGQGQLPGQHR